MGGISAFFFARVGEMRPARRDAMHRCARRNSFYQESTGLFPYGPGLFHSAGLRLPRGKE